VAEILQPDICIIGAGSGGLSVAAATLALGGSVVLIERGKMGGDCLNYGCVPSKALIAAAKRAHTIQHAAPFGVSASELKVNFGRVNEHVQSVIASIAPHDSVERFEALGAQVIQDHGKFIDKHTVAAGPYQIKARRFVIATGSRPAVPPIPGLEDVEYLTNETLFEQTRKPAHLIIVGGGPIGMEMAQAHRRLGAEVSVIELFDPLAKDDPELSAIALRKIEAEGVKIYAQTSVEKVEMQGKNIVATISKEGETQTITGSHILIAAGRQLNTDGLDLEKARIKLNGRAIKVNKGMKTSNRRVYAIGDVAGSFQFTHMAGYHAGLVVRNALFGLPVRENRDIIPWATFTDPEIAQVGLSESEANKRLAGKFKVLRVPFAENDRAQAERRTEGLVKMITDKKGRILGAGAVGVQAGEVISFFAYAIANKMKVGSLTKFVAPYPTISEIVKRVGFAYYQDQLDNPWLSRLRDLNRKLP
jgi:pyruvate/2-oxoglutarate dehydrogenase complex dihydrolipoamide dehydrogenase (E3) component